MGKASVAGGFSVPVPRGATPALSRSPRSRQTGRAAHRGAGERRLAATPGVGVGTAPPINGRTSTVLSLARATAVFVIDGARGFSAGGVDQVVGALEPLAPLAHTRSG